MAVDHHQLELIFGILGNFISVAVFLAPVPVFLRIRREIFVLGYDSFPYVIAIISSALWIYYAVLKSNANLLISINSVGCLIELFYVAVYMYYAEEEPRRRTAKFLGFGIVCYVLIVSLTFFLLPQNIRLPSIGWISIGCSLVVCASPLRIVLQVIRTQNVEFMPLPLSICLTLNAVAWTLYGLVNVDFDIAIPNILGVVLGLSQVVIYGACRGRAVEVAP